MEITTMQLDTLKQQFVIEGEKQWPQNWLHVNLERFLEDVLKHFSRIGPDRVEQITVSAEIRWTGGKPQTEDVL